MKLRSTLAVGYDAVVAIDPSIYTVTEDAAGRAWAFDMDSSRDDVEDAVRSVFRQTDLDTVTVTPGYVRVRIAPSDPLAPKTVLETLRSTIDEYNDRYATDSDLDGLAFARLEYIGTHTPEDVPEQATFLDRHAPTDVSPDSDGPVFTYSREDASEAALRADRRLRYRVVLPFNGAMYEQTSSFAGDGPPPVRWAPEPVQEALRVAVEDTPAWPGRAANTPQITVTPDALLVEHMTADITTDPADLVEQIARAFDRYNRYRNVDEKASTKHETQLHPPIKFDRNGYIQALDADRDAEQWIADHALDTLATATDDSTDGDPVEDADSGRSLNPFR